MHKSLTLFLYINLLSGPIPTQLENLTSLVNLDLSANALTGEMSYEHINLQKLKLLNLFMNQFGGSWTLEEQFHRHNPSEFKPKPEASRG